MIADPPPPAKPECAAPPDFAPNFAPNFCGVRLRLD